MGLDNGLISDREFVLAYSENNGLLCHLTMTMHKDNIRRRTMMSCDDKKQPMMTTMTAECSRKLLL